MKKIKFVDTFLYRWRYQISYLAISIVLVLGLALAGLYSPGGLTDSEQQAAITSSQINFNDVSTLATIDLPYHLLQLAGFTALGITQISIKLPSLLLALGSAIGMLFLLRRWFNPNVSVLAAILVITTGQFLLIAQSGTPTIMLIFWPIITLLLATLIAQKHKHRSLLQILLVFCVGLSLYTPLMVYIVIAMAITCLLHPRLRYQIRHAINVSWVAPVILGLVLIAPIGIGAYQDNQFGLSLLGIPAQTPDIYENLSLLAHRYFDVISPSSGLLITPVYGLGALALMALGAARLFRSGYTIRSYTIVAWCLLLLPFIVLQPDYSVITFVPLMLVLAIGIDSLIRQWYNLFPHNPYARIAGLIPLVVLISTLTITGVERYFYGYHYDPNTAKAFSNDLRLLHRTVDQNDSKFIVITGTEAEKEFYTAVFDNKLNDSPVDIADAGTNQNGTYIYTRSARDLAPADKTPDKIIVNSRSSDSDRLYIYKD